MPTIPVPVQADPTAGTLTVNDDGSGYQIEVAKNPSPQTIEWNLILRSGQTGSFNPVTAAANPGFAWTGPPPRGFASPTNASPAQITVGDTHTQYSNNDGTWTYRLCATVNGTLCQTNPLFGGRGGDPSIKNK